MGKYFTKPISAEQAARVIDTVRKDLPDLDWIVDARSDFCPDTFLLASQEPGDVLIGKGYDYMSARPKGLTRIIDYVDIPEEHGGPIQIAKGKIGPAVVTLEANGDMYNLTVHYYEDNKDLRKYIESDKIKQFQDYCKDANELLKIYLN